MTTERILAWMREQGFTVDEMLGGEAESLVLCILQGQPLDVKARRDADGPWSMSPGDASGPYRSGSRPSRRIHLESL